LSGAPLRVRATRGRNGSVAFRNDVCLLASKRDHEFSQSAAFANHACRVVGLERRYRFGWQPPFLRREVRHKVASRRVVLPHVVVVDAFLDQLAGSDQSVDRGDCGVGLCEKPPAADGAEGSAVDLDHGVGADHLEIEDEA